MALSQSCLTVVPRGSSSTALVVSAAADGVARVWELRRLPPSRAGGREALHAAAGDLHKKVAAQIHGGCLR